MSWTRLGDDFASRRWELTDAAVRLDLTAIIESNRNGWAGRIPETRLRFLVPKLKPSTVAELVNAGFWRAEGTAFVIADEVMRDQLSPEESARQRESNRLRQQRWRDKVRSNHDAAERNGVTPAVTGVTNVRDETHPGPSRPEGQTSLPLTIVASNGEHGNGRERELTPERLANLVRADRMASAFVELRTSEIFGHKDLAALTGVDRYRLAVELGLIVEAAGHTDVKDGTA